MHGAAHELKRGIEPESFLAGAPGAIRLYRNLQAAVERELDGDFMTRPRELWTPVDELSKEFKHLMDEDENEDEDLHMKDEKLLMETCSVRTRHKTKRKTPNSKLKKQERVSWQ